MTSPDGGSTSKITLVNLASDHLNAFKNVLSSILSTDLAQLTYSQIMDGLPVRDVWNAYACRRRDIEGHLKPCSEAVEVWKAFRAKLQPRTLEFNITTVQEYQNTIPKTKGFIVRLMELIAVACHDIAVLLYKIAEGGVGTHAEKPPGPTLLDNDGVPFPPIPTDFYHTEYQDWEQYPQGVADMVGYWAEFELFGGVVIFDRGDSDTEVCLHILCNLHQNTLNLPYQCKDAFIHPGGSYKIFQLSDDQLEAFAKLESKGNAITEPDSSPAPFPFRAERYARRVGEEDSMFLHIYRDKYERKPKINTSGRVQHPRVRLEDEPVLLDVLDILKANDWKLP
jgi:hypothetical protein